MKLKNKAIHKFNAFQLEINVILLKKDKFLMNKVRLLQKVKELTFQKHQLKLVKMLNK